MRARIFRMDQNPPPASVFLHSLACGPYKLVSSSTSNHPPPCSGCSTGQRWRPQARAARRSRRSPSASSYGSAVAAKWKCSDQTWRRLVTATPCRERRAATMGNPGPQIWCEQATPPAPPAARPRSSPQPALALPPARRRRGGAWPIDEDSVLMLNHPLSPRWSARWPLVEHPAVAELEMPAT